MKQLKFLIEKEFKQMLRNPVIPKLIILYPVMILLIFPWAVDFEIKDIRIDVVDHSRSGYSGKLTAKIGASKYFIVNNIVPDYATAMLNMEQGFTDMIVEIPATFAQDIVKMKTAKIGVAINAVNGTLGLMGNNYITQIVNDFSSEIRHELSVKSSAVGPKRHLAQIDIITNHRFNPLLEYKYFMIPGFMALLLTIICGILPALNIVTEKETGTIQQINVTPVSKSGFIIAKLIPYWVVGLIVLVISISTSYLIYRLWPAGNIAWVLLSGMIFIISISGIGIIISNYSETLQQSSFLIMFFILVIILLSGLFTPVSSMPSWAKIISSVNPFTYLVAILRMIYLNGSSMADISGLLWRLVILAALLNSWAIASYKKSK